MDMNSNNFVGIKPGISILDTEPKSKFAKNNAPGAGAFPMIIPEKDKNSGGLVGGIGYTAGKLGTGLAGVFEGIGKGVEGIGSLLAGDKEYAKYVFSNSEVDKWRKQLDDWYNPGSIMSFVGDAAEGVGQSSVFLLNAIPGLGQVGTAAFFVGAAGNGISDAVRTTGDIGAKEITYGILSSAAESAMEAVSGAGGKAAKAIAGKVTVGAGKRAVSNLAATAAKQATWKMIGKEMVTSAAGEFVEEFLGDFVDVGLRRMTGVDPNASTSVGQALYSGLVGAASGAIMGGASSAVVQRGNQTRGRRIIEAGNADATVGVAQAFSEQYAKSKDKLIRGINEELKTSIGAWNKVTDKSTPAAARIMGEIQSTLGNLNLIEAVQDEAAKIKRIVSEDPSKGEAMIQYLDIVTGIKDASNGFKAEDLLRDGSDALNLMSVLGFAGEAMTNSDSQVRGEMYRKAMNGEDISADKLNVTTDKKTGKKQQRVYSFYADGNTVIDENVRDAVYGNGTGERMALHNNGDGTYNVGFGDSAEKTTTYPHVTKERAEQVVRDFGAYGKQYIAEHELNYQKAAQTSGMRTAAAQTAQVSQVTTPGKIGTEDLKVKGTASENVAVKQETIQAENVPANATKTGNTQTAAREEIAGKTEAKKDGKGETGKSSDAGKTASEEKSSVEQIREKMTEEEKVRAGKNSARMKQLRERMVKTKQEIAQLEDPKAKRTMSETARENRLAKLKKQLETDQARYNSLARENERIGERARTGQEQAQPQSQTEQAKEEKRADFEKEYASAEEAKEDPGNNADERLTKISDAAWRDGQTYLKTFDRLSWDRKRAVCATIQSAKDAGVTSKLVISASAKLASIRSGLEIRFSDKVEASSWTKIDPEHGERLVLVSTKSADQIVIRTELIHEMIHDLRYTNSAAYAKIKKAAFGLTTDERAAEIYDQYTGHFNEKNLSDYLKENNLERTEENIDKYFEKYDGISRENVEEEITAKYVMNDARVNRLFDRLGDRSTWRKFCDVVSDFREAIAERFSGKGEDEQLLVSQSKSIEKTILKALGADYAAERVMRAYGYDGKEAYGERTEAKEKTRGEVKYEIGDQDSGYKDFDKPITEKDVEVLREIGRKSVNDFSPKDLKSAQKWAYKFYKELGVKSPFFRAWFGDWRAKDNSAVKVATIPEYTASNEARKQNRGIVNNADTGWDIRISRNGETNTISHSGGERMSEYGLAGVRQLVENAVLLDSEVHEHHSNNATNDLISFDHKLYALGESNEGVGLYKVTVEEYYQSQKQPGDKRFHNLKYIEKVAEVSADALAERNRSGGSTMRSSTTTYSISDLYDFVKRYDKDYTVGKSANQLLLNADGTPKVVYHGTNTEFWTFDLARSGKNYGDTSAGFFFFTNKKDGYPNSAADYARTTAAKNGNERIVAAYLDIRNPLRLDSKGYYTPINYYDANHEKVFEKYLFGNYDGVIIENSDKAADDSVIYLVDDALKIKSVTDNIGTFDGTNPDIRYNLPEDAAGKKDAKTDRKDEKIAKLTEENRELKKQVKHEQTKKAERAEATERVSKYREERNEARASEKQARANERKSEYRSRHAEEKAYREMTAAQECVKVVDEIKEMSAAMRGNTQIVRDEVSTQVIKLAEKIGRNAKNPFKESSSEVFDLFAAVKRFMVDEDAANPGMMAEQNGEWSFADRFTPRAKAIIEELAAQAGEGGTLSEKDLYLVKNGLRALKKAIGDADKVVINERKESLSKTAAEGVSAIREAAEIRGKNADASMPLQFLKKMADGVRKTYLYQTITPRAVIESLECYSEKGVLSRVYRDVEKATTAAADDFLRYTKTVSDFLDQNKGYAEHMRKDSVTVMNEELSIGRAIALYMTTKREQAVLHIEGAGVKTENVKGEIVTFAEDQLIPYKDRYDGKILTTRLQTEIEKQLTAEDKAYIGVLEKFFNDTATKEKCDADDRIQGFHDLMEAYYFPISSDKVAMVGSVTDARKGFMDIDAGVTNLSMNKEVNARAKNAIYISDVTDVFENHARQLSMYKNLYLPLQAFDRVYNQRVVLEDGSRTSVRELLNDTVWRAGTDGKASVGADKYLKKLFADLQGIRGEGSALDRALSYFRGNYAAAVLGANPKVVLSQAASYPMAFTMFDLDILSKALVMKADSKGLLDASALARVRFGSNEAYDSVTAGAGPAMRGIRLVSEALSKGIGWMDKVTIERIWTAAQLQAEKNGKGAVGTKENVEAAVELFEDVTRTTQPTYDTATRSGLQRSNSELAKTFAMFTSVGMKQLSEIVTAADKFFVTKKKGKMGLATDAEVQAAGKSFAKKTSAVAAATAAFVLMNVLVKHLTGTDDEDKNVGEELADESVSALVSMLPIASDIYSYLSSGYSINSFGADTIQTFADSVKDASTLVGGIFSGEAQDDTKLRGAARRIIVTAGKAVGLPVGNAQKYAIGILSKVNAQAGYRAKSYFYSKDYTNDMKKAIENGDEDLAANIYSLMEKRSRTGSEATDRTANEVTWLYAAGYRNVLAKQIGTTVNVGGETVTLTKKQKSAITKIYGEAEDVIEEMIGSSEYPELDDKERAAAIKSVYDSYYAYALSEVMGEKYSVDNALKMLWTKKNDYLYHVALAYVKNLKSETDANGKAVTGSRRRAAEAYLKKLGLSEDEQVIVLYGAGYRSDTEKEKIEKIISGKGLSEEQKKVLKTVL